MDQVKQLMDKEANEFVAWQTRKQNEAQRLTAAPKDREDFLVLGRLKNLGDMVERLHEQLDHLYIKVEIVVSPSESGLPTYDRLLEGSSDLEHRIERISASLFSASAKLDNLMSRIRL